MKHFIHRWRDSLIHDYRGRDSLIHEVSRRHALTCADIMRPRELAISFCVTSWANCHSWHCNTLHHAAKHYNILQHTHHATTHYNILQHTAAHCNTLQHTEKKNCVTARKWFAIHEYSNHGHHFELLYVVLHTQYFDPLGVRVGIPNVGSHSTSPWLTRGFDMTHLLFWHDSLFVLTFIISFLDMTHLYTIQIMYKGVCVCVCVRFHHTIAYTSSFHSNHM